MVDGMVRAPFRGLDAFGKSRVGKIVVDFRNRNGLLLHSTKSYLSNQRRFEMAKEMKKEMKKEDRKEEMKKKHEGKK